MNDEAASPRTAPLPAGAASGADAAAPAAGDSAAALFAALAARPYRFDFLQTLRRIDALFPQRPRLGTAARPKDEPIRLGQEASAAFAPRTLARLQNRRNAAEPRLDVFFFGLFGPHGALPLHLTEYARERARHHGDHTFSAFANLFHHRMLALFYRAWACAEPAVQFDRPADDQFGRFLGSLSGYGSAALRGRDGEALPDLAKLHYTGLLACQTGHADGLQAMLADFLQLPVRVEQFVGQWLVLDPESTLRLGASPASGRLGETAVIGARVWDRQHKFRLHVGPLSYRDYRRLLPGGATLRRLGALVRAYAGSVALNWDVKLILKKNEVPDLQLGVSGELGWTTWAAPEALNADPDGLEIDAARCH